MKQIWRSGRWILLAVMLCLTLVLSACGNRSSVADVDSQSGVAGGLNWSYDNSNHTLTITGSGEMPHFASSAEVSWAAVRTGVTNVVIANGVTSIGDYAFYYMPNLTTLTIPESVTSVGRSAFAFCKSLTSVALPAGVHSVGDYAFEACTALTAMVLPEGCTSLGTGAFRYCRVLESVACKGALTAIGANPFAECGALTKVELLDSVTLPEGSLSENVALTVLPADPVTVTLQCMAGETQLRTEVVIRARGTVETVAAPAIENYIADLPGVETVFDADKTVTFTYTQKPAETEPAESAPVEENAQPVTKEPAKKISGWTIFAIVVMVIFIVGIVVFAVILFRMDKKGDKKAGTVRNTEKKEKNKKK